MQNVLRARFNRCLPLGLLAVGTMGAVTIAPQSAQAANITGGKTTANPYVTNVSGNGGYEIMPLLTVGDEVSLLEGDFGNFTPNSDKTYAFAGIPDGLGLFEDKQSGDKLVFVNHEFSATDDDVPVFSFLNSTSPDKIQGARVSLFQFDENWNVLGGKNLIETAVDKATGLTHTLNPATGAYESITGAALSFERFCSGYLAAGGFVGKDGNPAPIWFAPEEVGEGRGWAVTPDGTAQSIDGLGIYAKENIFAASQYRAGNPSGKTVLLSTEDFEDGEIYMFVGEQTEADPNGFEDGDLYALRVKGFDYETIAEDVQTTAKWKLVDDEAVIEDGELLSEFVNAEGRSTNFRRPEDIHEDPSNPGEFYFVTTGRNLPPGEDVTIEDPVTGEPINEAETPDEADNPYGKLYHFSLNANDPTGKIKDFELVLTGGPGNGVSYDNIVVDSNGNVLIQEDETAFGGDVLEAEERDGRVLSYNIDSDTVTSLFENDENAAGAEFNNVVDPGEPSEEIRGEWESSGIIEVDPNALPGRSSYLFDVQASTVPSDRYVSGGQLILAKPVPEPGETAGVVLFGLSALGLKFRRKLFRRA